MSHLALVFVIRLLAIVFSFATLGIGVVILFAYLRNPRPRIKWHVVRVAVSYVILFIVVFGEILKAVINEEGWEWHLSPLTLIAAVLGLSGVSEFLKRPKLPPAPEDSSEGVV